MGYLNSQIVEVDAILTKKGRTILAEDPDLFRITKFAVADDEIDYRLWNTNHSLGTDYYGEVIESMPILEPTSNQNQMMKFKLISMDKSSINIPIITIGGNLSIELNSGQDYVIIPKTINTATGDLISGYTATLSTTEYAKISVISGYETEGTRTGVGGAPGTSGTAGTTGYTDRWGAFHAALKPRPPSDPTTFTVVGKRFNLKAEYNYNTDTDWKGTVTITGNETGGRIVLEFTVLRKLT